MSLSFHVRPRYTAGSPGMVREDIAQRAAVDEREFYQHYLEGAYGEAAKKDAVEQGLDGIVYSMYERGNGWDVHDLITDRRYRKERIEAKKLRHGDIILRARDRSGNKIEGRITVKALHAIKTASSIMVQHESGAVVLSLNEPIDVERRHPEGYQPRA